MLTSAQVLVRLLLALVLGGLVGFEREIHGRAAGFRTHILVCLGSTLIMLTSIYLFDIYRDVAQIDPGRIASGVITGIGFLGAGTIIRFKASVRGLTTAASLWAVAGVGLATGSGFYLGALTVTLLVLFALFFLTRLERIMPRKDWFKTLAVETKGNAQQLHDIRTALAGYKAEIKDFEIRKKPGSENVSVDLSLKLLSERQDDEIIHELMRIDGVESAKWEEV